MIKISTQRFGEMEFLENSVVQVIGGLIGLEGQERFVIIQHQENTPFYWLQSVEDPNLALVMVNPLLVQSDYDPPIPLSVNQDLDIQNPGELNLFAIVTIPPGHPEDMTANLLGPLVLNPRSRKAKQLVLDDRIYSHRFPVLEKKPDK